MNRNLFQRVFICVILSSVLIIVVYNSIDSVKTQNHFFSSKYSNDKFEKKLFENKLFENKLFENKFGYPKKNTIKIAITSCGDNTILEQTFVMIKSMLMFSKQELHFIIVVDKNQNQYANQMFELAKNVLERITFEIILAQFPNVSDPKFFRSVFRPCASQRLFYPIILSEYDSIIHIDNDVILMSPIEQLWDLFNQMNSTQMLGMGPDNTNPNTSYYKVYNTGPNKIPVPTEYSLNTGVILMNLTRMRQVNFFNDLEPIVRQYKESIKWFVNDFLSIYLSRYPDRYINISCHWNYLTDHCSDGQLCPIADTNGVALLHGSRRTFINEKREPAFYIIYSVFREYQLNSNLTQNLLNPLKHRLLKAENTKCGQLSNIFIEPINRLILNLN